MNVYFFGVSLRFSVEVFFGFDVEPYCVPTDGQ